MIGSLTSLKVKQKLVEQEDKTRQTTTGKGSTVGQAALDNKQTRVLETTEKQNELDKEELHHLTED